MAPTKLPATLVRTLRDHLVTVDGEVKKRSGIRSRGPAEHRFPRRQILQRRSFHPSQGRL